MIDLNLDLRALIARLSPTCTAALTSAAELAGSQTAYETQIEHLLQVLVNINGGDVAAILRTYDIEPGRLSRALTRELERIRTGHTGHALWSPLLLEWFRDAWLIASVDQGAARIRSGHLLLALLKRPGRYESEWFSLLRPIPTAVVTAEFAEITASSKEVVDDVRIAHVGTGSAPLQGATVPEGSSSLDRFTIDFTARARDGEIDPVFGRGVEIRQMVDILARRRKNNPIVVGDPGVGKTALIEGLALEIANETAPESLRGVRLLSLDMGLLQAGAGVKGEFENRLKEVIHEVKSSEIPIVLFIDEAHTMIGAGGAQGGGDAANLLKPALARGELRTIAATTWSEYKKYFEKDPALSRRFQLVKVDEPDEDNAIGMLRGIAPYYEESHGVRIFDEAVVACAQLGSRYVSGRQHPDKGVDLLDTAAARVKLAHSAVPPEIEALERQLDADRRTEAARVRDQAHGVEGADDGAEERSARIAATSDQLEQLRSRWNVEREAVARLVAARAKVSEVEEAAGDGSEALGDALKELEAADLAVKEAQSEGALIAVDVDAETVAAVVGDWTGIPVGSMVRDEIEAILSFDDRMKARIKGQDHAIEALSKAIRASKAGVGDPEAPIGVVLAVGTSGVGKTECGLGLADLLFGGDRFLTTINMSEYQEKHTVSRLIGSPPGYVGYGEGGRLTEAVRKAPYSVVLLDEVEKADPEVMNLFYQVFDKGVLNDSEGRQVNFRNTILYLTSNLGTDLIHKMCESGVYPSVEELREALHPTLAAHFKPALLARMTVIPFFPIDPDVMGEIARLKLNKVVRRIREAHRLELSYGDEVIDSIVEQCAQVDTGARNIDHILRGSLMPQLSTEILTRMATGLPETCVIGFDETEGFTFAFGE